MIDNKTIHELSRIVHEIRMMNFSSTYWINEFRSKSIYHYSDPNVLVLISLVHDNYTDNNSLHLKLFHNLSDRNNCKLDIDIDGIHRNRYAMSYMDNILYHSNGVNKIKYNNIDPSTITDDEYFNLMLSNPDVPDKLYFDLAADVDNFFINNKIRGSFSYNISTINLSKISLKEYW